MSSPKRREQYGVRGVIESSYLAGGTPGTTDGILPMEVPEVELEYVHDGDRGRFPLGGNLSRVAQSGLGAAFELVTHVYTPGAAYSASVLPSVDRLLRSAGFNVVLVTTPGSESVTYTPDVDSLESMFYNVFVRGQQFDISGVYHDLVIASERLQIPIWRFPVRGVGILPVDIAVPAITYPHIATQKPQKSVNIALALGSFTGTVVRSFEFTLGRELTERADENSAGHKGFTPAPRKPMLKLLTEAPALASFNVYSHRDAGTEIAVSMRHGASGAPGQYKRWTLTLAKAQIVSVNDVDDGPMAMHELEIAAAVTPGSQDDLSILFD